MLYTVGGQSEGTHDATVRAAVVRALGDGADYATIVRLASELAAALPAREAPDTDPYSDLAGISEIARHYGVTPQVVVGWRRRRPGFPTPVAVLAATPVYRLRDFTDWDGA